MLFTVSYDDSVSHVDHYMEENGFSFPVVMDRRMGGVTGRTYQVGGIPTLFLIDREGTIVERKIGFEPGDEVDLQRRLKTLLASRG